MPKDRKTRKKLGRDQEVEQEELVRRYAALKRFLEDNWGRIGLDLPRARRPEYVKSVLERVPNAKWYPAFRDFPTGCLLHDGSKKVSWREVRETREKYEEVKRSEDRLSLESHSVNPAAQSAKTAYEAAVAELAPHQDSKKNQRRLKDIANQLRVEELARQAQDLNTSLRAVQMDRESLEKALASQEAWLARSEVVEFVRDRKQRYSKTAAHFAQAMAGLPFYDWLYSIRKCLSIPAVATIGTTYWFQVFEMLQKIVKTTKSSNLKKIELKLRNQLLKQETDPLLRAYISAQWFYMTLAFGDCRGKRFQRSHIPYKIMGKFADHCEGHSVAEFELAKHHQLV